MTGGDLTKKIAESTQLKNKEVKGVFAALRTIAYAEVKKTEKFVIPQLTTLKLKHKPPRKAGTKVMFGKEVKVAAKPASKVVKAFPAKATQGLDLSHPRQQDFVGLTRSWSCHGFASNSVHG